MRWKQLFLFSALAAALTGCGASGNESRESTLPVVEVSARPELDWRTDPWNFGSLSVTKHDLYLQDIMQDAVSRLSGYEVINSFFSYQGDTAYRLDLLEQGYGSEEGKERKREFSLCCYDGGKMEMWYKMLPVPEPEGYGGSDIRCMQMDMAREDELVLFFGVYGGEGEITAYPAVHMDLDGNLLSVTDLFPAMEESGLEILPGYSYGSVCADRQGLYYLLPNGALSGLEPGKILVLDAEGKQAGFMGSEEKEAFIDTAVSPGGSVVVMKDPDGNALFRIYDNARREVCLSGYRPETGEKLYAQMKADPKAPMALSADGYLYYCTGTGDLYRWDLYAGEREFCVNYRDLGLGDSFSLLLGAGENGQLIFLDCMPGVEAKLYQLGTDPGRAQSEIRIVSLTNDSCQYISECAIGYMAEHPDYFLSLEKPKIEGLGYDEREQTVSDYRTRALADLVAGKGADMYYVTAGDMQMLYEKGALADLSDVLPQEYVDAIFPGFLECGVIDGKQIGLSPQGYVTVVMADNSLWAGESWSWDEAMGVKEANPQRGQLMIMLEGTPARLYGSSKAVLFREVYLRYLAESPFLDPEAGTCDFDSPRFIRLLEMLNDNPSAYTPPEDLLQDQWTVAFVADVISFPKFTLLMSNYGEEYHLVGYPSQKGGGIYWSSDYYLVVNKETAHMDQIREYLISMYDFERQCNADGYTVRNDLMEELLKVDEYFSPPMLVYGKGNLVHIALKPDGTTWDQEYLELLNRAKPYRNMDPIIEGIIMEEVGAYFSGDRDVEFAAAQIQNRVQLYLQERN